MIVTAMSALCRPWNADGGGIAFGAGPVRPSGRRDRRLFTEREKSGH
jgi:hypothetical protein